MRIPLTLGVVTLVLTACSGGGTPDPTPLAITGHTPAQGATNVSLRDPITVAFSRAVAPASVTNDSVVLAGAGGVNLAKTWSLSPDRRTLTVTPAGSPAVPNTLTLALSSALTDQAGNALTAGSWSWDVPAWLPFGGAINPSQQDVGPVLLALDAQGQPTVALRERGDKSTPYFTFVLRWTGTAWAKLGGPVNPVAGNSNSLVALALDASGRPTIAMIEMDGAVSSLYVQRWTGSAWEALGGAINPGGVQDARDGTMVLDASGQPVVALQSYDGTHFDDFVQRWDGNAWQPVGGAINAVAGGSVNVPRLALDASGQPVVAFTEADGSGLLSLYLFSWNGAAWQPASNPLNPVSGQSVLEPQLVLDAAGNPVVGLLESDGTRTNAYVYRWGSGWAAYGSKLPATGAMTGMDLKALALDASGKPVVALREYGAGSIGVVRRWTGAGWQLFGDEANAPVGASGSLRAMVLDAQGTPVVAFDDSPDGYSSDAHVTRFNQ